MRQIHFIIFYVLFLFMGPAEAILCSAVLSECQKNHSREGIPRCLEDRMRNCNRIQSRVINPDLILTNINSSHEARVETNYGHAIHISSEALQRSRGKLSSTTDYNVDLTVSVLDKKLFEAPSVQGSVHDKVLGVWLGHEDVHNLSDPVQIVFVNINQAELGSCVFWKQAGNWSSEGCSTSNNRSHFVCSCNHLSFFAVLISPASSISDSDVQRLEYITYIGSSLSVVFTAITIVMFLTRRKKKIEHSVFIHVQLSGSLFLLHMFFLASTLWSDVGGAWCKALGLALHWALIATFTWTSIEGFHLYLLLVRVFNIYIRRYLLKLSLVGWGVPVIIVIICGVTGEYGKYTLTESTGNVSSLCWIDTKLVQYITVNGYLGLVLLFNVIILVVMVGKMWQLRVRGVQSGYKMRRMWKDWATILGLSWVLGLPWALAFSVYGPLSLVGIYLFTILNGFQGFFMFLWFLSITCKSNQEEQSSSKNISMSNLSS